jgi:hypothetical protein
MKDSEIYLEVEEQIWSYLDLCAMYEKTPSVLGFAEHLKEAYENI